MGDTAQQHRASIGSFAGRIAASGWKKSSAGPKCAVFLLNDRLQEILLESEGSKIRFTIFWAASSIFLNALLLSLAAPTILQILNNGIFDKSTVQNEATSNKILTQHNHQENLSNLAFFLAVLFKVLLASGDIEKNPGPTSPTIAGKVIKFCQNHHVGL